MSPPAPSRLTLAELADGGGQLDLAEDGSPQDVVAAVLLERDAAPELLQRAAGQASRSGRVLIGVAEAPPAPSYQPLLDALSFTVVPDRADQRQLVQHGSVEQLLDEVSGTVIAAPRAAVTLVRLLRLTSVLSVADGLVAESLAYSTLLAGPEFASWRAGRPRRPFSCSTEPAVLLERDGATLRLRLNRPQRHNAFSRELRDALVEGLELAVADSSVLHVDLTGQGSSFCSGGDLDEFGTTPDVATAHLIRVERSAGALLDQCRDRVVARVHGACIGAGVELPSFAGRVEARADAFFQLPELSLGLVPGAGGTVSLTHRIGRWRTGYLALSGRRVDAETALGWGLVDAVAG